MPFIFCTDVLYSRSKFCKSIFFILIQITAVLSFFQNNFLTPAQLIWVVLRQVGVKFLTREIFLNEWGKEIEKAIFLYISVDEVS